MRIGIIGCGDIARKAYVPGIRSFHNLELCAVADIDAARAKAFANELDIPWGGTVDELLRRDDVDTVLNCTIPAAHAAVDRQILLAGKHAYSEKPLASSAAEAAPLLALAHERGLRLGCAPDTVLGAGTQGCRRLIDGGAIGTPRSFVACMACAGHESWHPAPDFYYAAQGGGPLYDMGPYYLSALVTLLGPVVAVSAYTTRAQDERIITSQPRHGERIPVAIDTQINAILRCANGAIGSLIMSFDVWQHHLPRIEIYGDEGSLAVPDPNTFGGPILLSTRPSREWQEQPLNEPHGRRGLGLADLADAIAQQRPHRASGELAYHVQEVMDAIHQAGRDGQTIAISSSCQQPQALASDHGWNRGTDESH